MTSTPSGGGRGITPPFNVSQFRAALPALEDFVKKIEATLSAPVQGPEIADVRTEYQASANDLNTFVVRGRGSSLKVTGMDTFKDHLVVSYQDASGQTAEAEVSREALDLVEKRNRALSQLEAFLKERLDHGDLDPAQSERLESILGSVSSYQSNLMNSIDRQLRLSERVVGN